MKKPNVDLISEEDLAKILLIGRIKAYCDFSEHNLLVNYYIATGEITLDCELARKILSEIDESLTNDVK